MDLDAKLKALKVVDLRQILATAKVSVPAKATKSDLITRIQSNEDARHAYAVLYPPDDLLAPPEEVDWNAEQPEVVADPPPALAPATTSTKPPSAKPTATPIKVVPVSTPTETSTTSIAPEDPEFEKRKRRAERFGIPLVAKQQGAKLAPQKTTSGMTPGQLEARAKRFGIEGAVFESKPNGKKRSAQTEDTDPEELERRKKRSERFGLPVKT